MIKTPAMVWNFQNLDLKVHQTLSMWLLCEKP